MKILKIIFFISSFFSVGLLLASSFADRYDCFAVVESDKHQRILKRVQITDYHLAFFAVIDNKEYYSGLLRDAVINDTDVSINMNNSIDYLRTYFDNEPSYILMKKSKRVYITQCRTKEYINEQKN